MKNHRHRQELTEAETKRKLSSFARRLSEEWKRLALPCAGERVVVAASGGADSTALLLALDELIKWRRMSLRLTVAHLDHGLRGEASAGDARWVEELTGELGYEFVGARAVAVARRAREARDNLEQAARRARYEFLGRVAREWEACAVVVAHTLDDQAETMLLALVRGSGAEGLGGMQPVRALDGRGDGVLLVRPLLGWARRAETVEYCETRGVAVRADEMNEDESFSRVRVRRRLLPLLETFNPRAVEALARTAMLLRADAEALEAQSAKLLEEASRRELKDEMKAIQRSPPLSVEVLRGADVGVRRRALRQWLAAGRGSLRRVELVHMSAVEKLLDGSRGGRVAELPGGSRVERRRGQLLFHARENETRKS